MLSGGAYSRVCCAADGPSVPYKLANACSSTAEPKSARRSRNAPDPGFVSSPSSPEELHATRRLAGFTSRWPTPESCVKARPCKTCLSISRSVSFPSVVARALSHHRLGLTTRKPPPPMFAFSFSFPSPSSSLLASSRIASSSPSVYNSDARDSPSSRNTNQSSVSAPTRVSPGMSSNADSYRATCAPPATRWPKYASLRPALRISSPRSTNTRFSTNFLFSI
mmetsp:Transcript_13926/g.52219  ORF Transcript_13926/g.52219 Transcript_13926/m.52219 type:complete len:223 (-) Transcript_13926:705-1373(-)